MRRRLLVLVAATTTIVLVAFLVPLALLLRTVAAERATQSATGEAQALITLVATTDRAQLDAAVVQVDATSPADISVLLPDGTVLGSPATRTPLVELAARGFSATGDVDGGREVVVAVASGTGTRAVARAFIPDEQLGAGVAQSWLLLAGLAVGLLTISLVVADRLGRRLVRATTELAAVSHRLAGGDLAARAATDGPGELGVVAGALNGLAGRIVELLREERETVADLAHRVRTPLTALRLEAEALADPDEAARVGAGVDGVQRAVTRAIEQARRRGSGPGPESAACDAAVAVRERTAFWSVLAEDTDREVAVRVADGPLPVGIGRADLDAAVDALLGNVFAHTPDGTALEVALVPAGGGGAVLTVGDAGPGLPSGPAPRRGASGAGSSGLGMDIARRAAERAGGRLELGRSPLGGLQVVLHLGPPRRP
ncbi:sensor histidine kinase [Pseudonocardia humida]|uniref:Signal transduction histidine-protein kinase/phosphatase MprB n=1 Tax=Pseudonocardia humida TaxID=2800819 RepID=A0ABT0ZX53_9PSEU|nr:HAMP domain-containing sensor histidine kinase [Pseudonocardia humida]MCO1655286.1 HAMP domain-containing histidine kinase [Pseudonocardia humida]